MPGQECVPSGGTIDFDHSDECTGNEVCCIPGSDSK
jgi:hypothetical protein